MTAVPIVAGIAYDLRSTAEGMLLQAMTTATRAVLLFRRHRDRRNVSALP